MEEERLIKDFQLGNSIAGELSVLHLLFANDTIIFCDASTEIFLYICLLLTCC